jgi:hypothetical protein
LVGMLRTVRVTRSLGMAVALTAVLAPDSRTAFAQSPVAHTHEPSRPAAPSPVSEDTSGVRPLGPPEIAPPAVSLFDPQLVTSSKPKAVFESWLSGVEMNCIACRGFVTTAVFSQPTNLNAPWVLQGTWTRQTTVGVLSTGFVGVRNYALPLSTAVPLGGDVDRFATGSWRTSAFAPSSQWYLTAAIEKTLVTRSNGASVGITADVLIPVETESISVDDPRISALTSRAVRFGVVVRW